ncbi:hypothetical protein TRFO_09008 [Tritrichomonas foetus]|uniref:FMP27/BLTP2/Hobbit GFWDK motif-containing RBG unit domain-containing protein n=1 Tax=Tritrichomonas foetus TaxID=1144522 RepID=A0A1J4JG80_9EUKA|nr:hypothetical protein TRFO_09008 [Tritrichomonas foetus]|eukprot:OHS98160.1 hypothetical protein TRFO_09008 [Tritrichomonas foetus]
MFLHAAASFLLILTVFLLAAKLILNMLLVWILSKKMKVKKGKDFLSFKSISFSNQYFNIQIIDPSFKIHPIGLLTSSIKFVVIDLGNIIINFSQKPSITKPSRTEDTSSPKYIIKNAFLYFIVCLTAWILRFFNFSFKSFQIDYMKIYSLHINGLSATYKRIEHQFQLDFDMGAVDFAFGDETFQLAPISNSTRFDLTPILTLYNFETILIPFGVSFPLFEIIVEKNEIKISSIEIKMVLPRGNLDFTLKNVLISSTTDLPLMNFKVKKFELFKSAELIKIQKMNLNVLSMKVKKISIMNENRPILKASHLNIDTKYKTVDISCRYITLSYHTLTGLTIIPFLSKYIHRKPLDPNKPHFKLVFPDINVNIQKCILDLKLTNTSIVKIDIGSVKMKDRIIVIPSVVLYCNSSKMITGKPIKLTDDSNYLHIIAGNLQFHDRKEILIKDFLTGLISGWKAIAPYVLDKNLDKETIPFPIMIEANTLKLKFHDSGLNSHLSRATQVIPFHLLNNAIRQSIFEQKIKSINFPEDVIKSGHSNLAKLTFKEYRKSIESSSLHKYSFIAILLKPRVIIDCTNFTHKIDKIHDWDPSTKEFYPNIQYDLLIGGNFVINVEEVSVKAFDIVDPIIMAKNISYEGPAIIAEGKNFVPGNIVLNIEDQTIEAKKNPCQVKLFSKGLLIIEYAYVMYGSSYAKIYQELSDIIGMIIPSFPDPSPKLEWWDALRAQLRGKFSVKADHVELRLTSSEKYRETKNYISVQLDYLYALSEEGKFFGNANLLKVQRFSNSLEGPTLLELPQLEVKSQYSWITKGSDHRLHFIFPNVSKFEDDFYDSFSKYRAIGLEGKISVDFSQKSNIIPCLTFDFAHLEWTLKPILSFLDKNIIHNKIKKKYHVPYRQQSEIYDVSQLKFQIEMSVITRLFGIHVYDYFPITDNNKIRGSSIDIQLFNAKFIFDFVFHQQLYYNDLKYNCSIQEFLINVTDISKYSSMNEKESPTFLSIRPIRLLKDDTNEGQIQMKEISLYFNQIIIKYLIEFLTTSSAIQRILSKQNKKVEEEIIIDTYQNTYDRFSVSLADLKVNSIRLILASIDTDLISLTEINNSKLSIKADPSTGNLCQIYTVEKLSSYVNSYSSKINYDNSYLVSNNTTLFFASRVFFLKTESIYLLLTPPDYTSVLYVLRECFSAGKNMPIEKIDNKSVVVFSNSFSFNLFVAELKDENQNTICKLESNDMRLKIDTKSDKSYTASLVFTDLKIRDLIDDMSFPDVLCKWNEISTSSSQPLILIQLTMCPSVAGSWVFSHAEINLSPTIVNFEEKFFRIFIKFFNYEITKRNHIENQTISKSKPFQIPYVTYQLDVFPIEESITQIIKEGKSSELKIMKNPGSTTIMLRYFRVNPIQMKVTYKNPSNKLISEIKNFQGQLSEILYHDFSGTVEKFIEHIAKDVGLCLIPQFLKHVVGIKNKAHDSDKNFDEWLNTEDKKMSKNDKRKAMLFGSKNVPKK